VEARRDPLALVVMVVLVVAAAAPMVRGAKHRHLAVRLLALATAMTAVTKRTTLL
jgi:hypothetical protein